MCVCVYDDKCLYITTTASTDDDNGILFNGNDVKLAIWAPELLFSKDRNHKIISKPKPKVCVNIEEGEG